MRRRPPVDPGRTLPARLVAFDPGDWPASACHPACAYWAAFGEWAAAHPEVEVPPEVLAAAPDAAWHAEAI